MADVEATHPSVAPSDAIIDDGEEAESKVYHILPPELEFPNSRLYRKLCS